MRPAPLSAATVREHIAEMQAARATRQAQLSMAKLAIEHGNISPEGKDVYRQLIDELAGAR